MDDYVCEFHDPEIWVQEYSIRTTVAAKQKTCLSMA